jgi:SAM-dependent methyltransferase
MSHPEQRLFIKACLQHISSVPITKVIEFGSFDVNGEIRSLFSEKNLVEYIGVDLIEGPGVDIVGFGHEVTISDSSFDVAVSVECLEHDQHWKESFQKLVDLLELGGWLFMTCAGKGRQEHGTRRSNPGLSPGTTSVGIDYYKNLTVNDFKENMDLDDLFSKYQFIENRYTFDLYFIGQKRLDNCFAGASEIIRDPVIREIFQSTPVAHKIVRIPMRLTSKFLPNSVYQHFAFRYWNFIDKIQIKFFKARFSRQ